MMKRIERERRRKKMRDMRRNWKYGSKNLLKMKKKV